MPCPLDLPCNHRISKYTREKLWCGFCVAGTVRFCPKVKRQKEEKDDKP